MKISRLVPKAFIDSKLLFEPSISKEPLKTTRGFFDAHSHHHNYRRDPGFYVPLATTVKKICPNNKLKILDLGCGDGSFIKGMIGSNVNAEFIGTDISTSMIEMSQKNLDGLGVDLLVADGFKIPFKGGTKFDVIHIDSVLHHLIARNVSESTVLAINLLDQLTSRLIPGGLLIIEEVYYDSYLLKHFTSSIIFYGLKLLNFLHIDLSNITNEIVPGLEVNFFEGKQLFRLLQKYGEVRLVKKSIGYYSKYKKLLLLKEWGHITLLVLT